MKDEYNQLKIALDDVIYSWAKLKDELHKFNDPKSTYYPINGSAEDFLQLLVSWRSNLDLN
ncbi:hypothetical protein [Paenibacillus aquistagni]|uniref:hypothetical protein n=1 Tax=Paenibacillus aquistagni TaxID=1852522 RepID=UPI00145BEA24|nr:hypothetical protein [Paenibacillus aquistagni]NMM53417.1 hypothetical protein [Paenibacillus aquistagni]